MVRMLKSKVYGEESAEILLKPSRYARCEQSTSFLTIIFVHFLLLIRGFVLCLSESESDQN
jgi:hypothetical protein